MSSPCCQFLAIITATTCSVGAPRGDIVKDQPNVPTMAAPVCDSSAEVMALMMDTVMLHDDSGVGDNGGDDHDGNQFSPSLSRSLIFTAGTTCTL